VSALKTETLPIIALTALIIISTFAMAIVVQTATASDFSIINYKQENWFLQMCIDPSQQTGLVCNPATSFVLAEIEPATSLPSPTPTPAPVQPAFQSPTPGRDSLFGSENTVYICMALVAIVLVVIVAILLSIERRELNRKKRCANLNSSKPRKITVKSASNRGN
jgi:hypothetical protein